ncbi:MAG: hypothetical protein RJQ09_06025 [Cyclobacteriaceae bacterium]
MFRLFPLLAIIVLYSCDADLDYPEGLNDSDTLFSNNALLRYTGSIAVDGCEFFIDIDEVTYKPINEEIIPEGLKQSEVVVNVSYKLAGDIDYQCGLNPKPTNYPAIELVSIKKG